MRTLPRIMTLAVLTGMLIVPVSEARTRIYLKIAPPPIVVEQQTRSTRNGDVWQEGHHRWNGQSYAWTAGTWSRPPHRNAQWVPGRWVQEHRGYYWVDGHWSR